MKNGARHREKKWLKISSLGTRWHQRGFTLTELLVGLVTSSIFLAATAGIAVETIKQDRRESAKIATQGEVQLAMDYIRRDLQEAVFVYSGQEMQDQLITPGYVNANDTPVLAFWKIRAADECEITSIAVTPPAVCTNDPAGQGIGNLSLTGNMFVLVVYYWQDNTGNTTWPAEEFGPARISRLELDAFNTTPALAQRLDYRSPQPPNYIDWPYVASLGAMPASFSAASSPRQVLTAFVDSNLANPAPASVTCPADYNPSTNTANGAAPSVDNAFYSIFACVYQQNAPTEAQDVILYLRGNGLARAGNIARASDSDFYPSLQTRVFARGNFAP